jgi:hypothetical protein
MWCEGTTSDSIAVNFMWARSQRPIFDGRSFVDRVVPETPTVGATRERRTLLDVRDVHDEHAAFAIGLRLPDVAQETYPGSGPHEGEWTTWYTDGRSWASVDYVPGGDSFEVHEDGPRSLWAEVEAAFEEWRAQGEPPRERHGVTVTPDGQRTWPAGPRGRVDPGPASE